MPEENPETIVRKVHEAFGHRDLEAFLALWAEDGEYEPAMERDIEGDEGVFRGHEGIRRWWRSMSEAWNDWDSEVHKIRQAGEQVLVFCTVRARGRRSDMVIEAPFFQLATIRGGKIVASRDFSDHAEALEAAGLSE